MITFSHVTKRFGNFTALDDLSLAVAPQQAIALWGPNGAGKTTAIKCLLGLLRYEGRIMVDSLDARRQGRAVRRNLGYVPQELAFYEEMSTLETVEFFCRLKQTAEARIPLVLKQVALEGHTNKPVHALSGGMKQRLALALALLADPAILVLDEPTSNLDTGARDHFLQLLRAVKAAGKTVVFTSHRLEEVELLADQVLILAAGKVVKTCAPADLPSAVGLQRQIKLRVPSPLLDAALQLLSVQGYHVHRNGSGLLVQVAADGKAAPINALNRAEIPVSDFELE